MPQSGRIVVASKSPASSSSSSSAATCPSAAPQRGPHNARKVPEWVRRLGRWGDEPMRRARWVAERAVQGHAVAASEGPVEQNRLQGTTSCLKATASCRRPSGARWRGGCDELRCRGGVLAVWAGAPIRPLSGRSVPPRTHRDKTAHGHTHIHTCCKARCVLTRLFRPGAALHLSPNNIALAKTAWLVVCFGTAHVALENEELRVWSFALSLGSRLRARNRQNIKLP